MHVYVPAPFPVCFKVIPCGIVAHFCIYQIFSPWAGASISLSHAALIALGHPLDKKQTLSNWAGRPLSEAQQSYAALDVLVLPGICRFLLAYAPTLIRDQMARAPLPLADDASPWNTDPLATVSASAASAAAPADRRASKPKPQPTKPCRNGPSCQRRAVGTCTFLHDPPTSGNATSGNATAAVPHTTTASASVDIVSTAAVASHPAAKLTTSPSVSAPALPASTSVPDHVAFSRPPQPSNVWVVSSDVVQVTIIETPALQRPQSQPQPPQRLSADTARATAMPDVTVGWQQAPQLSRGTRGVSSSTATARAPYTKPCRYGRACHQWAAGTCKFLHEPVREF
jgi:hypothetical protein